LLGFSKKKSIETTTVTPALHQTLGFGFFKALDHS